MYPRYTTLGYNVLNMSDGGYVDASYLRLNNVAFSYALPEKWIKKIHMQGCSLSFNVQNLFTITGYKGLDPEVLNYSSLPTPRAFTGSLSFNF
jgi:hypothetical protein